MNTFKRKSLYVALAGLGALGATGAADAVNVNPDGLGMVLIYPYYTTRAEPSNANNAYNSLLSVVNSTASAKAVKVRFLEGKNSREVLDFNLFLSAYDVWTAAILPSASGGAKVGTLDRSCTLPALPAGGQDFVNFAYVGGDKPNDDTNGNAALGSLDRTREGYVEIIEMGEILDNTDTHDNITHVNGVPADCGGVTDNQARADTVGPGGGLFGGMTLININAGTDYTEDAVALDNFVPAGFPVSLYADAGSISPQLTDAAPVSTIFGVNGQVVQTVWIGTGVNTADAVSAVLMHDNVMNEFVLDSATKSGTDWVVTMPTKRFYVGVGTGNAPRLFQRNFNSTAGSCDDVTLDLFDREEFQRPGGFSPPTPGLTNQICWEANVINFNNPNPAVGSPSVVLGSTNSRNITTSFQNGWMRMGFFPGSITAPVHQLRAPAGSTTFTTIAGGTSAPTTATYFGLPVVGFAVQSFTNGNLPPVNGVSTLSNYGGNFVHKGSRFVIP